MGIRNWLAKTFKPFYDQEGHRKDLEAEDRRQIAINKAREREEFLKTPEGQEELRKERIADYQEKLKDAVKNGRVSGVEFNLEEILNICTDEESPTPDEMRDALYTASKNQAAAIYDEKGIDPANIASVVQDVVKAQEKLLGEPLEKDVLLVYLHRELIENATLHLRAIRNMPNSVNIATPVVQKAIKLLDFCLYSPEERTEQESQINKLYAQHIQGQLKFLAQIGMSADFEHYRKMFIKTLENAHLTPEQKNTLETWLKQARISCYNARFLNYTRAFEVGTMSLRELIDCTMDNNQVAKAEGFPKSSKVYARITPAGFKTEIERLLCSIDPKQNGKHPISKRHANAVLRKVKKYIPEAKLTPEQTHDLTASISRIRDAYRKPDNNGHQPWRKNGKHQMYKNPRYDRRARSFTKKHR